jgi:hypothetical protein
MENGGRWQAKIRLAGGRLGLVDQAVPDGIADELGVRFETHFLQDTATMCTDRFHAQGQLSGDLRNRFARGQ